jgi:hypothetical protein
MVHSGFARAYMRLYYLNKEQTFEYAPKGIFKMSNQRGELCKYERLVLKLIHPVSCRDIACTFCEQRVSRYRSDPYRFADLGLHVNPSVRTAQRKHKVLGRACIRGYDERFDRSLARLR